jgi:predicted Zn-dependent protease with MMP-like domain
MDPRLMPPDQFEPLVADALDALPDWIMPIVAEIAVIVEDEQPAAETRPGIMLLGQYRGYPRTHYGGRPPGTLPDTITLYRIPILLTSPRPEDVPDRVLKVLGHEVGHALGLPEARLRELGWH